MRKSQYIFLTEFKTYETHYLSSAVDLEYNRTFLHCWKYKSLYFVDCVIFCDDTFQYSGVSLSSSYEAEKDVYGKAIDVEDLIETNREWKRSEQCLK